MNCAQLVGLDKALSSKEAEISALKERILLLEGRIDTGAIPPIVSSSPAITASVSDVAQAHKAPRRGGKAPPISKFSGEDPEYILDDWLPSLERASQWNAWSVTGMEPSARC